MNPYLAYAAFLCLSSLLVGLLIGRRFLDRTQRTKCHALAQDLTDKVHDRCDAYRRLEDRISCAIGDFDRREADLRSELMGKPGIATNASAATSAPAGTMSAAGSAVGSAAGTAASADALAWMDDCTGGCAPLPPTMPGIEIADRLNAIEGSATNVEGQVDAFSTRLADAQEQSHLMLLRQSRAIEELERRLRGLETSAVTRPPLSDRGADRGADRGSNPTPSPAPAPAPGRTADLETLVASLERSQRDLLEWQARAATASHAHAEPTFTAPTDPGMDECKGCRRARELAREILDLVPGIVPAPKPAPAPERPAAPETSRVRELEQRLSGIQGEVESLRTAREASREERSLFADEISKRDAHVEELEKRLQGLQSELSRAGHALHGNRSQITQLMQTLEETKARSDARDRLLEEQKSHVSAAYAMLDRMRPLLHAIESTIPGAGGRA